MRPLRICLVSAEYPPEGTGGIAAYVYQLAYGLAEAGHDVSVIAGPASGDKQEVGNESSSLSPPGSSLSVHLYRVDNRRFPLPRPVRRRGGGLWNMLERSWTVDRTIARLERTEGAFDVVEVTNSGPEGLIYSLHSRAPLVIRLSTPLAVSNQFKDRPSTRLGFRLSCYLEALAARRADCVITNSRFNAECCGGLYRIPFGEMHLVPHGIVAPECPQAVQVTKDRIATVLYVGRLQRRKGIDLLLQAIPSVTAKVKRVRDQKSGLTRITLPRSPPMRRAEQQLFSGTLMRIHWSVSMQNAMSWQRRPFQSPSVLCMLRRWFIPNQLSHSI